MLSEEYPRTIFLKSIDILPIAGQNADDREFKADKKTRFPFCINKARPFDKGGFYASISNLSDPKISSSRNSERVIPKPLAIRITVLKVTVLLRPFIMHCILPCWMPDACSRRYCDIPFSFKSAVMRLATASLTVKTVYLSKKVCRFTYIFILASKMQKYKKVHLHTVDFFGRTCYNM